MEEARNAKLRKLREQELRRSELDEMISEKQAKTHGEQMFMNQKEFQLNKGLLKKMGVLPGGEVKKYKKVY